ncbi:MAG: hypothetical protein HKL80_08300 [Acidimicrobiales bacterium]|nr:hypothetical protein [Acidimicrobiales bacterium]
MDDSSIELTCISPQAILIEALIAIGNGSAQAAIIVSNKNQAIAFLNDGTARGAPVSVSIAELVDTIAKITETESNIEVEDKQKRPDGSEVKILLSDPSKAKHLLNWQPAIILEEGIEKTVLWWREQVSRCSFGLPLDPELNNIAMRHHT